MEDQGSIANKMHICTLIYAQAHRQSIQKQERKNIFSIHSIHVFKKLLAHLIEHVTFTTIVISQKKSHKTDVPNNSGGLKCGATLCYCYIPTYIHICYVIC